MSAAERLALAARHAGSDAEAIEAVRKALEEMLVVNDATIPRCGSMPAPVAQAPCITSSFQAECVVLTHMLRTQQPDIPVLFLDTFHHFAETLKYRDEMTQAWGLNLINLRAPEPRVGLWQAESTEACCARHKVGPLFSALEDYDVWFTALRRDQSPSRANLQEVEPFRLPSGKTDPARRAAGRVDGEGRLGLRETARHPAAAALRPRLHEHRLRAVHVAAARSRQPALGPLAGPEARVRDSHSVEIESQVTTPIPTPT